MYLISFLLMVKGTKCKMGDSINGSWNSFLSNEIKILFGVTLLAPFLS